MVSTATGGFYTESRLTASVGHVWMPLPFTRSQTVEDKIRAILKELGENPEREGLLKTPSRVAESLRYLTRGYRDDPKKIINGAIFAEDQKDMVILKNIDFFSLCEHHMLPFFGKCHIGYIPKGKIIGLSKLARLVDVFARRMQVQERLTAQIAHTLAEALQPTGVGVVMEAQHLCMQMRGVERQNSMAVTSSMLGEFHDSSSTRAEFMSLIRRGTSE
jgi:GTP cyclohydrolase I